MPDAEGEVEPAQRFQRILRPTDFSAFARTALPHVHGLVRRNEAGLVLLHVLTPAEADVEPGITGQIWDSLLVEGRRRAEAQLALLAEELQSLGVRVETLLGEGVAFQEILRVAERQRCDLIILASHGRTGLGHVLIGSVAEKVVRRASCPVFVVRPPGVVPPDWAPDLPETDHLRRLPRKAQVRHGFAEIPPGQPLVKHDCAQWGRDEIEFLA